MKTWKIFLLLLGAAIVAVGLYGARLIWRGFSTASEPSYLEKAVARTARNLSVPRKARLEANPWKPTPEVLKEARESFLDLAPSPMALKAPVKPQSPAISIPNFRTFARRQPKIPPTAKSAPSSALPCVLPA